MKILCYFCPVETQLFDIDDQVSDRESQKSNFPLKREERTPTLLFSLDSKEKS